MRLFLSILLTSLCVSLLFIVSNSLADEPGSHQKALESSKEAFYIQSGGKLQVERFQKVLGEKALYYTEKLHIKEETLILLSTYKIVSTKSLTIPIASGKIVSVKKDNISLTIKF